MAIAVVQGAMLICTCGSKPSQLIVTSQTKIDIEGKLAATVEDKNPIVNVAPFGDCKPLSGPCVPAFAMPWSPGSTSIVQLGAHTALLSTDKLMCNAAPGVISITDPGQDRTDDL